MQIITRECPSCSITKQLKEFRYYKGHGRDHYFKCITCEDKEASASISASDMIDPRFRLLINSRNSAMERGIEHRLVKSDIPIPVTCCYLDIPLLYKTLDNRAGGRWPRNLAVLDRIDSSAGYTKENIQVISHLANCMKYTASIEELVRFAKNVLRTHT